MKLNILHHVLIRSDKCNFIREQLGVVDSKEVIRKIKLNPRSYHSVDDAWDKAVAARNLQLNAALAAIEDFEAIAGTDITPPIRLA
jgi:hypothetical protein